MTPNKTRFSQSDYAFHQRFIDITIDRYNSKFKPKVTDIRDLIEKYQALDRFDQSLVFSDRVNGVLVHTMDSMIGKQSYYNTSFAKKHFSEVIIPKYVYAKWPAEELQKLAAFGNPMIQENLEHHKEKKCVVIKRIMSLYGVEKLPYDPQVAYSMFKYTYMKLER